MRERKYIQPCCNLFWNSQTHIDWILYFFWDNQPLCTINVCWSTQKIYSKFIPSIYIYATLCNSRYVYTAIFAVPERKTKGKKEEKIKTLKKFVRVEDFLAVIALLVVVLLLSIESIIKINHTTRTAWCNS